MGGTGRSERRNGAKRERESFWDQERPDSVTGEMFRPRLDGLVIGTAIFLPISYF